MILAEFICANFSNKTPRQPGIEKDFRQWLFFFYLLTFLDSTLGSLFTLLSIKGGVLE